MEVTERKVHRTQIQTSSKSKVAVAPIKYIPVAAVAKEASVSKIVALLPKCFQSQVSIRKLDVCLNWNPIGSLANLFHVR